MRRFSIVYVAGDIMKEQKITIKVKIGAKKVLKGIGLALIGAGVAFVVGYFFFIGGMV